MIGKIIGAFVGSQAAKQNTALGGAGGAAMGVAATMLLRRMTLPALLTIGAGGYLAKKLADKGKEGPDTAIPSNSPAAPILPKQRAPKIKKIGA